MQRFLFALLFFTVSAIGAMAQIPDAGLSSTRKGTFYLYGSASGRQFKILRGDSLQAEIELPASDTSFWKIHWLGDSLFKLTYLSTTAVITPERELHLQETAVFSRTLQVTNDYYIFRGIPDSLQSPYSIVDTMWFHAR